MQIDRWGAERESKRLVGSSIGTRRGVSLLLIVTCVACSDPREALRERRPLVEHARWAPQLFENPAQMGPVGRWQELRTPDTELDSDQRTRVEALRAIGYVGGSRETTASGVVRHDETRTQPGLNLYSSGSAAEAFLMTMDGEVLHRWHADFWSVWPGYPVSKTLATTQWWRRVALLPDGGLLALFEGLGLVRLDRESRVVWARPMGAHHDLALLPDGGFYVLSHDIQLVPARSTGDADEVPIYEDYVERLDASGRTLQRFSLLDAFEASEFGDVLSRVDPRREPDLFHTNTVHVLAGDGASERSPFAPGHLLISLRSLDLIAVVDPQREQVVWALEGRFRGQHDPSLLANGNLLLFDNLGSGDRSEVLELDREDGSVAWRYRGDAHTPLYSEFCGTAARLPNGNTLITETDNGRALEVTPTGEIVWEFYNPQRFGDRGEYIASIAEMIRLDLGADTRLDWIPTR